MVTNGLHNQGLLDACFRRDQETFLTNSLKIFLSLFFPCSFLRYCCSKRSYHFFLRLLDFHSFIHHVNQHILSSPANLHFSLRTTKHNTENLYLTDRIKGSHPSTTCPRKRDDQRRASPSERPASFYDTIASRMQSTKLPMT